MVKHDAVEAVIHTLQCTAVLTRKGNFTRLLFKWFLWILTLFLKSDLLKQVLIFLWLMLQVKNFSLYLKCRDSSVRIQVA